MIMDFIMYLFFGEMMLFGLFVYLFGAKRAWAMMRTGRKEPFLLMAAVLITICYFGNLPVPLPVLATLAFSFYLWWQKFENVSIMELIARGALAITISLGGTISLGYYYFRILEKQNIELGMFDKKVVTVCVLQMCLLYMFINTVRELIEEKNGSKRVAYVALGLKAFYGMFWIPRITGCPFFLKDYLVTECFLGMSIFLDYAVFFMVAMAFEQSAEIQRAALVQQTSYEYYLQMEEEHLRIRRLYHDLKNQLMVLSEVPGDMGELLKNMVDAYQEEMKGMEKFYHTGSSALDMLLFDTEKRANEKHIVFDVVFSENCMKFMSETDLCVIFTNLLKNAFEACEKIENGEKKISIRAGRNRSDIMVYVKNTVAENYQRRNLQTSKVNKLMHGIGLSSVKNIVEKYSGYMSISDDDGFQITMLFRKGTEEDEKN